MQKVKYQLLKGRSSMYSFVTTSREEKECIEILKEKSQMYRESYPRWFTAVKIQNGETDTLERWRLNGL